MKSDLQSKSVLLSAYAKLLQEQEPFPGSQAVLAPFGQHSEQAARKKLKKMFCPVFPKYMSRTILHFDLGLGPYSPEKKLFFLAEPICPLAEIDAQARCWPRRVPKALKQFSGVYYMIICHFGSSWGHLGTHGGPQMAQNSTKMV